MLRTALQVNLQKDMKMTLMEQKLYRNGIEFNPNDFVPGDFVRFANIFPDKELSALRGLDLDQKNDSTFLGYVLKCLYKDCDRLSKKFATERAGDAISPSKMTILKSIFEERVDAVELDQNRNEKRKKRLVEVLSKILFKIRGKTANCQEQKENIVL